MHVTVHDRNYRYKSERSWFDALTEISSHNKDQIRVFFDVRIQISMY